MLIEPYIEKNYPRVRLYSGINEIEEELMNHRFFIVMEDHEKYMGMLTVPDVFARKKKLVADCLSPKPYISPNSTIEQAIILMTSTHLPALPVVDDNQEFHGILSQDRIVEALKELQTLKHKAYEQRISVSERIKKEFIQSISHEIRTPLNAIQGLSEVLIYSDIAEEEKENYAGLLHAKTDELLNVVDSLLNLSRLEAGDFNISVSEKIDPSVVCEELMNQARKLKSSYKKDHITITYSMQLPRDYLLNTNLPYLQQVMIQLINNAIKFTENGHIEFGCYPGKDNKAEFFVKDTGTGIPREKQKIIFQAFEKAWSSDNQIYPGMGLGLTIASKIIESAGGHIWFESVPGKGSCFFFNI